MVRITIDLIRKRSEHNEGEISTLEEISLHQENIDKIELLDKLCRNLKILLLQYNIIPKIENLNMLKKLEYLNLALNNIEVIENLQGLESLKKLDLTINFIGDLRSVKTLRYNENLEQLILTGNPCTDYEGYREYVISTLPQLKELDMIKILRSERIKSLQVYAQAKGDVIRGYDNYKKIREAQIKRYREKEELKITEIIEEDEDAENERFWKQKSYHTPEDRIAIAEHTLKAEEKKHGISDERKKQKYVPKLFSPSGKPYNMNHPKVPFTLNDEDDQDNVILDVGVYRYLDTSYIDVDIQPTYVRVTIKGKILQLTLPCEILVDKSSAKRNVTTGSLVITMPRLHPSMKLHGTSITSRTTKNENPTRKDNAVISIKNQMFTSTREFLEIGPSRIDSELDFSKIFENSRKKVDRKLTVDQIKEKAMPDDFIDNPEVPPLE